MRGRVTIRRLPVSRDVRGLVFEPLGAPDIACQRNVHIVVTLPAAVRGNHQHLRGTEQTAVVGPALVRYREDGVVHDVRIPDGEAWCFEFPPGVAHAFLNTGSGPMLIASFNTVAHDPSAPDVLRDPLIECD